MLLKAVKLSGNVTILPPVLIGCLPMFSASSFFIPTAKDSVSIVFASSPGIMVWAIATASVLTVSRAFCVTFQDDSFFPGVFDSDYKELKHMFR